MEIPEQFIKDLKTVGQLFVSSEPKTFDEFCESLPEHLMYSTAVSDFKWLRGDRNALNSNLLIMNDNDEMPDLIKLAIMLLERVSRFANEGGVKGTTFITN